MQQILHGEKGQVLKKIYGLIQGMSLSLVQGTTLRHTLVDREKKIYFSQKVDIIHSYQDEVIIFH